MEDTSWIEGKVKPQQPRQRNAFERFFMGPDGGQHSLGKTNAPRVPNFGPDYAYKERFHSKQAATHQNLNNSYAGNGGGGNGKSTKDDGKGKGGGGGGTPAPKSAPSGRDAAPPDGSDSQGTNTGFKGISLENANAHLNRLGNQNFMAAGTGIADFNTFKSEALPITEGGQRQIVGFMGADGKEVRLEGDDLTNLRTAYSKHGAPGVELVYEGISTPGQGGVTPADSADNTRAVAIPGEGAEPGLNEGPSGINWMEPRQQSYLDARTAAFLDPNNKGYGAIRAADAATGRYRQGNEFYMNDGGELKEVSREVWDAGRQGAVDPMDFKNGYIDRNVAPGLVPAGQRDITTPEGDQTESGSTLATPGAVEQTMATFGGGYEPQSVASAWQSEGADNIEFNFNNAAPEAPFSTGDMKSKYFGKFGAVEFDTDEEE